MSNAMPVLISYVARMTMSKLCRIDTKHCQQQKYCRNFFYLLCFFYYHEINNRCMCCNCVANISNPFRN